jgi:hypothetical protein
VTARERARELWQNDPRVRALYDEARKQHGNKDFCKNQFWYATPGPSGPVGLKFLMLQIPLGDSYDYIYHAIHDALPPCNHKGGCRSRFEDTEPVPQGKVRLKRQQRTGFFSLIDELRNGGRDERD